jgi:hypothetical protein
LTTKAMAVERKMKKMLKEAMEKGRGFVHSHYQTRQLACFPSNSPFDVQYLQSRLDVDDSDQKHEQEDDVYQLHSQSLEWCFVDRFDVDGRRMEGVLEGLSKQKLYISGSSLLAEEDKYAVEDARALQQRLSESNLVLDLPVEAEVRAEPVAEEGGNMTLPPALEKPLSVDKPALPVGISALSSLPLGTGTPLTARGEGGLAMSKPFGATLAGGGPSVFNFAAALPSSVVGGMMSPVFQGFALPAGMWPW